jgi:hypothetical protein
MTTLTDTDARLREAQNVVFELAKKQQRELAGGALVALRHNHTTTIGGPTWP